MPETLSCPRRSPLADILRGGRYGAPTPSPGVAFALRHPLSIIAVIARAGQRQAVAAALRQAGPGCSVHWAGFEQYYVVAEGRDEGALWRELRAALADIASVSDQSHGRIMIRASGPNCREVLSRGTPVDLDRREFPIGRSAITQIAHVGVHLTRIGDDTFDLSVFRGFAESFWEWLASQAAQYGYQVL